MEDIFDLAVSNKERDFVKSGLEIELEIATDMVDTFSETPFIGPLIKLGRIGKKFQDLHFIRKLARFLEKEQDMPKSEKEKFLRNLDHKDRQKLYEYLMHYLLRAEDDVKADIMGYVYEELVYGRIDKEMFLRLCSIIDRAFVYDLKALPDYLEDSNEDSVEANNFINLGLIDNYAGGTWLNEPIYELNDIGKTLYNILHSHEWFGINS